MFDYKEFELLDKMREATVICLKAVGLLFMTLVILFILSMSVEANCSRNVSLLEPELQLGWM